MSDNQIGLSDSEVLKNRERFGSNSMEAKNKGILSALIIDIIKEPMFLLLLTTCIIYFIAFQIKEGVIMLFSIFIVAAISVFQEYRSRNAVEALRKYSATKSTVKRNNILIDIPAEEIVVNDIMLIKEGELIAADGLILESNDLFINESIITGEAFPVNKNANEKNNVYKGTLIISGGATIKVTDVGTQTMLGKISSSMNEVTIVKTPLQKQIRNFVQNMIGFGLMTFLIIVVYSYYQTHQFISSLLKGLTLAMSILPEEIPIAFSTFQALGAYRLLKNNSIIVKQPQFVETLGSATVICADKTGTITKNLMRIECLYDFKTKICFNCNDKIILPQNLIEYAMWSSETDPFDPMEKSIHELYAGITTTDKRKSFKQIHEYPIGGQPPLMTHIFKDELNEIIIAAKGAPEAIMNQSDLTVAEKQEIDMQSKAFAIKGYRVLAIGKGTWKEKHWPATQQEFVFEFLGLIAFQDPPKDNIVSIIETFHRAGIGVKMITGDYPDTAIAIASQIHLNHNSEVLTGQDVLSLDKKELNEKVKSVNIFARMFPEAKLKVINALKENGEVVAMTGDGVNDGPALKAAHIGIAMGKRGSEVAKESASLILTDDDLSHMTDAIAIGRKIYDNLKKAIQYIVSIHVPIILIVLLPILLQWKYNNIFSPVHVIFLELIMGPTCSIIYENEPMEPGTMNKKPRRLSSTFFSWRQILLSILQGLMITSGCLIVGYIYLYHGMNEETVRAVIFINLLFANIFLTLVNRSFVFSVFKTIKNKNNLVPIIIIITLIFILLLNYFPAVTSLFALTKLTLIDLTICFTVAFVSTCWIEPAKWIMSYMRQS